MQDKVIEWLEENMNKQDYLYFEYNTKLENIINCYFKEDNRHFCILYKNVIEEIIKKEELK